MQVEPEQNVGNFELARPEHCHSHRLRNARCLQLFQPSLEHAGIRTCGCTSLYVCIRRVYVNRQATTAPTRFPATCWGEA